MILQQPEYLPASCRSLIVDSKLKGDKAKLRLYEWSKNAVTEESGQRLRVILPRDKLSCVHDEPFASKSVRLIFRGYEKVSATVFLAL